MASCTVAVSEDKVDKLKSAKKCLACGRLNAVAKKKCACGSEFVSKWKSILKESIVFIAPVVLTPERLRSKVLNDGYQSSLGAYSDVEVSDNEGFQVSNKDNKLNSSITHLQNEISIEVSSEKLYAKPKRIRKIKYGLSFDFYDQNLITAQKASVDSYNEKMLNDKKLESFALDTSVESCKEGLVSPTSSISSSKSSIYATVVEDYKEVEDNKNFSFSETTEQGFSKKDSFTAPLGDTNITLKNESSATSPPVDLNEQNLEKNSHDKNIDVSFTGGNEFIHFGKRPIGRPRKHLKLNVPKRAVGRPRKDGKVSDKMSYYQRKKAEKLRIKTLQLEIANISEHHTETITDESNPKLAFRSMEFNQPNELHKIWENKFVKKRGRPKGSRDTRPRQKKKIAVDYNDNREIYESALEKLSNCGSLNMALPKKARCLLSPPSLMSSIIRKQKNNDSFDIKDNEKSERKQEKENYISEEKKEIFSLILDEINRKIISQKCFL
ncbi:uncharacterized protein LOC100201569 isoform X1 [Hydra vulgaris]|uniref:uncharacterized protein LOC100201569 isoform X1 n=1 Tax=Hydra vulgaris TaxID=6087 RepID=UPI001F5EFE10|nr:uncharacterized protein LOC100201569 isoform X1 [Hydra vulgaris]XP_047127356.1 uncharacterized protein LOC100201569 isoform X1 [Hydra vulgaris]XP_047127363.1 uncharacterized protein LOC100201569 isoform X1 [Hydra vulgaris]XP_047127370.1 uncharacterized protein LOC100201569 isoform X1 [Hydra vulgaris]